MPRLLLKNLSSRKGSPSYTCSHHMPELHSPAWFLHVQLPGIYCHWVYRTLRGKRNGLRQGAWRNQSGESARFKPGQTAQVTCFPFPCTQSKSQQAPAWNGRLCAVDRAASAGLRPGFDESLHTHPAGSRCAFSLRRQKVPCHTTYVLSTWQGEW